MPLSKAEKSELKLKFGQDLLGVDDENGTVFIFKTPEKLVYAQFMAGITSEKRKGGSKDDMLVYFEQLCIGCFVYPEVAAGTPDYDRLTAFFTRKPGAPTNIGGELSDMAGAGESLKLGKL